MSCNACSLPYGIFRKEFGCPNCGFSFCKGCLKRTMNVEKYGGEKKNVCLKCFDKHEKNFNTSEDKLHKQNSVTAVNTSSVMDEPLPKEIANEDIDIEIQKRLKNLRAERETVNENGTTNDIDIAKRVAALKGIEYRENQPGDYSFLNAIDNRTEQEQSNDLLKQFLGETAIDNSDELSKYNNKEDPVKDIARRLNALKVPDITYKTLYSKVIGEGDNDENEEENAKRMVSRYMEEASLPVFTLEEKEFMDSVKPAQQEDGLKELPWCTICNEDAIVRCEGCDGDLFCRGCFEEIHDDDEYKKHPTTRYVKQSKSEY